jgi:hypothetical protein
MEAAVPHADQDPADEVFETASQRLLGLLADTIATANPNSLLAYKAAYAFTRLSKSWKTSVDEHQVNAARKIVWRVTDLLEAAPAKQRADLRTVRHTFESLIDLFEMEGPRPAGGKPDISENDGAYYIASGSGGAGPAPDSKSEG